MDKQNVKNISIPVSYNLDSTVKINPVISRYVIRVMYPGKNRNGSYFSKETIEKMVETIGGVPVIGHYDEAKEDFMAHGDLVIRTNAEGELEIFSDGTDPYGFVNLTPNYWWAPHQDKDGITREYLNVEVFLWTGRYPELERLNQGKNNHSMEIEASGEYKEIDGEDYFVCDENSYFKGLCILGEQVEPCFEGSAVVPQFSLVKEQYMAELNTALTQFNLNKEKEEAEINLENYVELEKFSALQEDYNKINKLYQDLLVQNEDINTKYQELNTEHEAIKENYTESMQNLADVQDKYNALLEENTVLTEKISSLEEENQNYLKTIEKTNKKEVIDEYKNKISPENYNLLMSELENYSMQDLKIKTLEFSVDYLTKNNLFNKNSELLTMDTDDSSNIALYDNESWQARVLAKQQEEK